MCSNTLQFLQNLQPFKEDVIRKESVSAMSVENYTPDNMSLPVNNQLDLYNTHLSEGNKLKILTLGSFFEFM